MGDVPDDWIGVYSGGAATAPTDWKQYKWYKIKGEKGDTGDPATLVSAEVTYQVSDSGTILPSGEWSTTIPVVAQGKYLWTRIVQRFNTGDPVTAYTIARMGMDGLGSVSSVCGISPNAEGNVALTASDVDALADTGGDLTGELRMNGQPITGLNDPVGETEAARKGYVDKMLPKAGGTMTGAIAMGGNKITGLGTPTDERDAVPKSYAANKRSVSITSQASISVGATHTLNESIIGKQPVFASLAYVPAVGIVSGSAGNRTILFCNISNVGEGLYVNMASFSVSDDGLTLTLGFTKRMKVTASGASLENDLSLVFGNVMIINA